MPQFVTTPYARTEANAWRGLGSPSFAAAPKVFDICYKATNDALPYAFIIEQGGQADYATRTSTNALHRRAKTGVSASTYPLRILALAYSVIPV